MVHRPADSRLLTNLLSQEKDYSKHLGTLLDHSHASLASFSAYASASAAPASQVILAVASSLANADEALRRYAASVDEWREHLKRLKGLEDEVGNIMRDREILVTRLIKASKTQKPNRDSILINQPYPSSSSLSLGSDFSGGLNTSTKLAAAQSELQACEAHLAAKERELDVRRTLAVKEGLSARCRAMTNCGWVWNEVGKDALRHLDGLEVPQPLDHRASMSIPTSFSALPSTAAYTSPQASSVVLKALPDLRDEHRPSSDLSIAPSQSASQVNLVLPETSTHIYSDANYIDSSQPSQASHTNSQVSHTHMQIPPAHSISDFALPHSIPPPPTRALSPLANVFNQGDDTNNPDTSMNNSSPHKRHILSRRITEEDLNRANNNEEGEMSSDDETGPSGNVVTVENPRFAKSSPLTPSKSSATMATTPAQSKRFSIRSPGLVNGSHPNISSPGSSPKKGTSAGSGGGGLGFFGSLRGLFKHKKDESAGSDDDEDGGVDGSGGGGGLFGMKKNSGRKWQTRTERNLNQLARTGGGHDSDDEEAGKRMASVGSGVINARSPMRQRVASDVGAMTVMNRGDSMNSGSAVGGGAAGRRLKKGPRQTKAKPRSSSVPPEGPSISLADSPVKLNSGGGRATVSTEGVKRAEQWLGEQESLAKREQQESREKDRKEKSQTDGKAWASESEVVDLSIGHRKPKTKTKPSADQAVRLHTTSTAASGSMPDLTRNASIQSGSSDMAKGRRMARRSSLGSAPPLPPLPNGVTSGHRRTASVDLTNSANRNGASKGTPERKLTIPAHSAVNGTPPGNPSLMSIVEGVAKDNRTGRVSGDKMRSVGGTERPVAMMEIVKAPPSIARKDLDAALAFDTTGLVLTTAPSRTSFEIPRAPRSVFDPPPLAAPVHHTPPTTTGLKSAIAQKGATTREAERVEKAVQRPAKSPLRSALRNTSRSPSPLPELVPPIPASLLPTTPSLGIDVKDKGKQRMVEEDLDDVASISSQEVFVDAPETLSPVESQPVRIQVSQPQSFQSLPPPITPVAQPQAQRVAHVPASVLPPTSSSSRPQGQAQSIPPHLNGGSDLSSTSTDVTPTQSVAAGAAPNAAPQRRKSVRVSLKPTFSPSPIDFGDEDQVEETIPWKNAATTAPAGGSGFPNGSAVNGNEQEVRDMWQDSSDEDVDYQRAKRLLNRAARKEKKVW